MVAEISGYLSIGLTANVRGEARHGASPARVESRELVQRHILERAANGGIDALPGAADAALALDAALAGGAAAFRDRDRALEHVEDLRRRDLLGARARR